MNSLRSYADAIKDGLTQSMDYDESVILIGQLVDTPSGIFGTTTGLVEKFGEKRVRDFPISENLMTSVATGLSLAGYKPIICHQRMDFALYSMDAIVNWLSLWHFKSNKKSSVGVVIRAVVGKGWGQGPQHSKSLHGWFAGLPGINVAVPSNAFDAKGILIESIFGNVPTIIIENRALFSMKTSVPNEMYQIQFGKARISVVGDDITVIAIGVAVPMALKAAEVLSNDFGVSVEVIDPITLSPFDWDAVTSSASKTKNILVVDPDWECSGFAGEIVARIVSKIGAQFRLKADILSHPHSHTPMSAPLEKQFYFNDDDIVKKCLVLLGKSPVI